jgi:hypothetical protein
VAVLVTIAFQGTALRVGAVFVGLLLLFSAVNQMRTGVTKGLSGRGTITRSDNPLYFSFMFLGRIVLGPALLLGGIYSRG